MSGNGHIIIRSMIRQIADLEIVKTNISPKQLARLLRILGLDDADWKKTDVAFLLQCISQAHDKLS